MKTKNPQSKDFKETAILVLGSVAGAVASRAVVSLIHTPTAGADATTAKKESTMLLVKRGAIVVASGYGASAISGTDDVSKFTRSACLGMATMQVVDTVKDLAGNSSKLATATGTKANRVMRNALGLSCACDTPAPNNWGMGRTRRRGMKMPAVQEFEKMYNPLNEVVPLSRVA